MILFERLVAVIGPDTKWHNFTVGNCTAHRSPGFFAMVFEQGSDKCCSAEGATAELACEALLVKIANLKPPVKKMPGF